MFANVAGPTNKPGLYIGDWDRYFINATAAARTPGQVFIVDPTVIDSGTFECTSLAVAATATLDTSIFVVLLENAAINATVRCRIIGDTTAQIAATAQTAGTLMSGTNAAVSLTATATGQKVIAILKEATTATNQLKRVHFNGYTGIASSVTIP